MNEMVSAHLIGLSSDMAIMSLLALSAYLLLLVGKVSFGQQAFFGLGAYASGVMSAMFHAPLLFALVFGMGVGALCSWLVALPTMPLSGLNYAVATLAFGEMARVALSLWYWQIDLGDGLVGPAAIDGFRDIRWLHENDVSPGQFFALTMFVLFCILILMLRSEHTRLGVALRMTGQDETLAATQGINVSRLRLFSATVCWGACGIGWRALRTPTTYVDPRF